MRTVCLCVVVLAAVSTEPGTKVGNYRSLSDFLFGNHRTNGVLLPRRTDASIFGNKLRTSDSIFGNKRRTDASIFGNKRTTGYSIFGNTGRTGVYCNTISSVSPRLRFSLGINAIRDVNAILVDNRVTKAEVTSALNSVCRSLSSTADAFEEDYLGCPNDVTIIEAMEHLGPMCLRSGNLSTFARDCFTEVNLTVRCIMDVMEANEMCGVYDDISVESAGYNQDLTAAKRIVRDRYRCVLQRLNIVNDCGSIDDVKRGYLMLGSLMIIKPGLDYTLDDFF